MILPEFCSDGWRSHALLLTYALDPLFFETVVLRRLEIGGAHRVLVLADAAAALPRVAEAAPELKRIGRSWAFAPVRMGGSFHPKLVARFGREDASVAVLSGNLTPSGWGRNLEVGAHWLAGPGHEDGGGWLADLVTSASTWSVSGVANAILNEIQAIPWIRSPTSHITSRGPFLAAGHATVFGEIRRRWQGRSFSRASIATGSTDSDASLVRELVDTFGVSEAEVFVSTGHVSFVEDRIKSLPLAIWSPEAERRLHAKVVWLTGPDGHAAVWGSANCSRAAWLIPPSRGGNVELVVVDDAPDPAVFTELFEKLRPAKQVQPLQAEPDEKEAFQPKDAVEILEAEFRPPAQWTLRIDVPSGVAITSLSLRVEAGGRVIREFPMALPAADGQLAGTSDLATPPLPLFARLRGIVGGEPFESQPAPVNQPAILLRAQLDPEAARRVSRVTPDKMSFAEREAVLLDLFDLAWREFSEVASPPVGPPQQRLAPGPDPGPPPALDPLYLICEAASGRLTLPYGVHQRPGMTGYLSSFDRLLWGVPGAQKMGDYEGESGGDDVGSEGPNPTTEPSTPQGGWPQRPEDLDQKAEDAETLACIRGRLAEWIRRLSGSAVLKSLDPPATAYRCAHFVISISQSVCRARWIPSREATDLAISVIGHFLRQGRTRPGLVSELTDLCSDGPLADSLQTHIRSGRLLGAFVNALTAEPPDGLTDAVERGSMLARLRNTRSFVEQMDPHGLESLCNTAPDAQYRLSRLALAAPVASAAEDLDAAMRKHEAELRKVIGSGSQLRPDIFWSRAEGWMPDGATSVIITPNIGWRAASRNPVIRLKAEAVMQAWTAGNPEACPPPSGSLPG